MFTINQINDLTKKVKSGADFPRLIQDLKSIGVTHYENFVTDGQTNYYGIANFILNGAPKYPVITVNANGSSTKLKQALSIHQKGETDYPTFCKQAAEAGVEKWVTNILEMTVTYIDKQENNLVVESIPQIQ